MPWQMQGYSYERRKNSSNAKLMVCKLLVSLQQLLFPCMSMMTSDKHSQLNSRALEIILKFEN